MGAKEHKIDQNISREKNYEKKSHEKIMQKLENILGR